jgi:hypothetical protein
MPIERTDRVATGVAPGWRVATTTPSAGTSRRRRRGVPESWDIPEGARWGASSAALSDLHDRVVAAESKAAHLEVALATNRRIGIAVGILMCRLRVTEDEAFAVLRKHSQDNNVKVRDLAEEIIYTGRL